MSPKKHRQGAHLPVAETLGGYTIRCVYNPVPVRHQIFLRLPSQLAMVLIARTRRATAKQAVT